MIAGALLSRFFRGHKIKMLSSTAQIIYVLFIGIQNNGIVEDYTHVKIAQCLGCSTQSVHLCIKQLRTVGLVDFEPGTPARGHQCRPTNKYTLLEADCG